MSDPDKASPPPEEEEEQHDDDSAVDADACDTVSDKDPLEEAIEEAGNQLDAKQADEEEEFAQYVQKELELEGAETKTKIDTSKPCGAPECDKPGTKHCSNCNNEFYCSPECQQQHWKLHWIKCQPPADKSYAKELSPKLGFTHTDEHGRCVVALEDIEAGEVLLVEEAISIVSKLIRDHPKKPGSYKVSRWMPRGKEMIPRHPTRKDEIEHAEALKQAKPGLNSGKANAYLPHHASIMRGSLWKRAKYAMVPIYDHFVCRQICTGLFSLGSWFNHSCDTNTKHSTSKEVRFVVEARRDIAKGEEVTISILPEFIREQCVCRRQEVLEKSDVFIDGEGEGDEKKTKCWCERCAAERDTHERCGLDNKCGKLMPRTAAAFSARTTRYGMFSPVVRAFIDDFNENGDEIAADLFTFREAMLTFALFAPEEVDLSSKQCTEKERAFAIAGFKKIRDAIAEHCPDDFTPRPEYMSVLLFAFDPPNDEELIINVIGTWADTIGDNLSVGGRPPFCSVLAHFSNNIFSRFTDMFKQINERTKAEKSSSGVDSTKPSSDKEPDEA